MRKAICGLAVVGAVIALGLVLKRRVLQKMQQHCQRMAAKCRQMMAGSSTERARSTGMPDHCQQMAEQVRADDEPAATREPEQDGPQFVGSGEAIGTA
jgi:uncharacterized membrane protein YccC